MKRRIALPFVLILVLSGCAQRNQTENQYLRMILTSAKWQLEDVKIDDINYPLYQGLEIGFTAGEFTAVNGEPVWPATGKWDIVGFAGDRILRGDGLPVAFDLVTADRIVFSFNWESTTTIGGRQASIGGRHVMTMKAKK